MMKTKSQMLQNAAEECVYHALDSFERESWNMAIRRAQEAVELGLKSILADLGIDYPKDHDQAPLLIRVMTARKIEIAKNVASEIERISADLSRKRGPALQQEEGFDKETAINAIQDMNYVMDQIKTLKVKIR